MSCPNEPHYHLRVLTNNGKTLILQELFENDTINNVKELVSEKTDYNINLFILTFNGEKLENEIKLKDIGIKLGGPHLDDLLFMKII